MKRLAITCSLALLAAGVLQANAAGPPSTVVFRILDAGGKPAAGAKVFLYQGDNVRRPADFISPPATAAGAASLTVPSGKYRAVARLKQKDGYGPLMPGDRHSGEPVELEVGSEIPAPTELVVTDIREARQRKRSSQPETREISGRVMTPSGAPLPGVWVYAHRSRQIVDLPDYLSAWTDSEGRFRIHVAAGQTVHLGAARSFPPSGALTPVAECATTAGKIDIVIDMAQ